MASALMSANQEVPPEICEFRKQKLEAELAALEPPVVLDVTEAAAVLTNFALFGSARQTPRSARRSSASYSSASGWTTAQSGCHAARDYPPVLPVWTAGEG